MAYLEYKRNKIYYEIHGKGPALLYIHEWNTSSLIFKKVNLQFFQKNFMVILLDLPGYGKSEMVDTLTFEVFEEIVTRLLDKLKIRRASMMGFCMGGNICLDYAIRSKNRVNRVIVVDMMLDFPNILKPFFLPVIGKMLLNATAGTMSFINLFTKVMFNKGNLYVSLFKDIAKKSHGNASFTYMRVFYDYSKLNQKKRLHLIKAPLLSINGDHSPGIVKRSVKHIAKYVPTSVCTEVKNSRHFVMLEHPQFVYEQVKGFMEMKL